MANNEIIGKIGLEGGKEANVQLESLQKNINGFNKGLRQNYDATRLVDQLTGGMATKMRTLSGGFQAGIKGVKGLNLGLKGMKSALIATGIGAFVVLFGTIVAYWDEIVDFITGATREQERLNEQYEKAYDLLDDNISLTEAQLRLAKLKGEDETELLAQLRQELIIQQELTLENIARKQEQLELLELKNQELTLWEGIKIAGTTFWKGPAAGVAAYAKFTSKSTEETLKLKKEINEETIKQIGIGAKLQKQDNDAIKAGEDKIENAKKLRLEQGADKLQKIKDDAKLEEEIATALALSKEEKRALEREAIDKHYADLKMKAVLAMEDSTIVELELRDANRLAKAEQEAIWKEEDLAEEEAEKERLQQIKDDDIADKQKILDDLLEMEEKKRKFAEDTLDNAARMAGEETKLGRALLLAKQLIAAKAFLISIGALKAKATVVQAEAAVEGTAAGVEVGGSVAKAANSAPPPANAFPIIAAITTGIGIMASIMSAVKATKSAASKAGGTGGGSTPTMTPIAAPSFNVVGQSDTNQLAETITGTKQEPIQAYVVSNDVTTAQGLERNIVEGATI